MAATGPGAVVPELEGEPDLTQLLPRQARRLSGGDPSAIKDIELGHVCEEIYDKMEDDTMMDILSGLQDEYLAAGTTPTEMKPETTATAGKAADKKKSGATVAAKPAPPTKCASQNLLWDVVATPAMMRAFSATVANGPTPVKAA